MSEMALNLSDSAILPFDLLNYATFLQRDLGKLERRYGDMLAANGATFGNFEFQYNQYRNKSFFVSEYFRKSVDYFSNSTNYFVNTLLPRLDTSK